MWRKSAFVLVCLAVLAALVLGSSLASATKPATALIDVVTVPALPTVPWPVGGGAVDEVSILAANVSVNIPGDEEWKAIYGASWGDPCINIIEDADNALYSVYGINLVPSTCQDWDSNDSQNDIVKLLNEAKSERGLNGKQLMIAFTAQVTNCGAGELGGRYSIVADSWAAAPICQHEIGHNYGALGHLYCRGGCNMNDDPVPYYGAWCSACYAKIWANRESK